MKKRKQQRIHSSALAIDSFITARFVANKHGCVFLLKRKKTGVAFHCFNYRLMLPVLVGRVRREYGLIDQSMIWKEPIDEVNWPFIFVCLSSTFVDQNLCI